MKNIDNKTVESFGEEWTRFDQQGMPDGEAKTRFEEYFSVFPWDDLPMKAEGFDMGCGSGRWAEFIAPHVGLLNCIDPSKAIKVAKKKLNNQHFFTSSSFQLMQLLACWMVILISSVIFYQIMIM